MIEMGGPFIGIREKVAVWRQMSSGSLAQGKRVLEFETKFGETLNVDHVIAVNSGTSALHLGCLALGLGPGDEVIVPSFTFAASANAIELTGAKAVFCDIDLDFLTIDPNLIQNLITPRTKAIMAVHLFGQMADMVAIKKIADAHNLWIIEDAAQAHGASLVGIKAGQWGNFAAFSFYPTKNITTSEGGVVVTNSKELDRAVRLLRNQGMLERYQNEVIGFNNRMTELSAVIGLVQISRLAKLNKKRLQNSRYLDRRFRGSVGIKIPNVRESSEHVFHQYTLLIDGNRDEFVSKLIDRGISCGVYYPTPVHKLKSFSPNSISLPISEYVSSHCVSLPINPRLKKYQMRRIADAVLKVVQAL